MAYFHSPVHKRTKKWKRNKEKVRKKKKQKVERGFELHENKISTIYKQNKNEIKMCTRLHVVRNK